MELSLSNLLLSLKVIVAGHVLILPLFFLNQRDPKLRKQVLRLRQRIKDRGRTIFVSFFTPEAQFTLTYFESLLKTTVTRPFRLVNH